MNAPSLPEREILTVASSRRLLVGLDGSSSAGIALEWAAREAAARSCSLAVVTCRTVCADDDHALDGLLDEALGAQLLIVGASTSGAGRRWLFGSIPRTMARRSSCPVVVVRGHAQRQLRRIVVGVDRSNAADAALDWATDEAAYHGSDIRVVHALAVPTDVDHATRARDLHRADAECMVDIAIRHCARRSDRPATGEVIEGDAAQVLIEASMNADLLVVGSRGRSGFKTLLFGSVALSVVEHAACPVVVVHPRLRTTSSGDHASISG